MEKTTKPDGFVELTVTDPANTLHRIGAEDYPEMHQVTVPQDSVDEWEECPVPAYSQAEYEAKVAELIRLRYTADEEFALQRKMIDMLLTPAPADADSVPESALKTAQEYTIYTAYAEQCKRRAKELLAAANE